MPKKQEKPEQVLTFPMAPMLDMMFQILVFFVATYRTITPEAHLVVNLPAPARPTLNKKPPTLLEIRILPDQYLLNGAVKKFETLQDDLTTLARQDSELTVMIKVSPKSKVDNLVQVLDICKTNKLNNLNLLTLTQ